MRVRVLCDVVWCHGCTLVLCVSAAGAAASAAIAIERGTFSRQEWEEQLGPDPAKLDNTFKYDMQDTSCSH